MDRGLGSSCRPHDESGALLDLALQASGAGHWSWDLGAQRGYWSDEVFRMFGEHPAPDGGPVSREIFRKAIHPEDLPQTQERFAASFVERKDFLAEYRIRRSDGAIRWIRSRGRVVADGAGRPRMVGVSLDVTAEKLQEARLSASEERFRTAVESSLDAVGIHSMLQSLIDNSAASIFVKDEGGRFLLANPRVQANFGLPESEILGKTDHELVPPAVADVFRQNDLEVLRSEHVLQREEEMVVDGEVHTFLSLKFPLRDHHGKPYAVCGVSTDITAFKRAEAALHSERQRTEEALRAADRRKDEFLAMLSHELRNPLATIRNAVGVLRCLRTDNPRIERLHDMIDRQSEQLARMVDDLLDIARIAQGKLTLRKERIELAAIVSRAVETSRPLIDAAGHALSIKMPAGRVMLEGDLGRLSQVLSNLLNNAAKYTETRGQIRLSAEVRGDEVQIRVEDNGIGIAPDVLPHIFDLFTQSSRAIERAQGGLGIGLTLVRTLVEMHGGKVSARSGGTGQGAEFTLRLSICHGAPAEDLPAPTSEERGLMRRGEHRRILVVDDNVDAAESMALMLGYLGHETRVAHDGPSTLHIASAFQPELVLLDIGLPGLDGYEVARRLRAERETRAAVLVAITGYGQEEDRKRARRAGFDHHLTKPVDHDRLISLIDTVVTPVDVPA